MVVVVVVVVVSGLFAGTVQLRYSRVLAQDSDEGSCLLLLFPICKLLFLVGLLNLLSNSLSAGPKLLGVEAGSNSSDLPVQLLLRTILLQNLQTAAFFFQSVVTSVG